MTLFARYQIFRALPDLRRAEETLGGSRFDLLDGNRYQAENWDVAAYMDANVVDSLSSHSDRAIPHLIIHGNNDRRVRCNLVGQAIDMGCVV